MILEIQQFDTGTTTTYRCYKNKKTICDVIVPYDPSKRIFYFNFMKKNKKMELCFTPRDKSNRGDILSRYKKHIYCNNELQGYIASTKEYGLFEVEYLNRKYKVYNIDDAEACCQVVKNDMGQLIAEIERYKKPYKQMDHYTAYTEDESLEELLCMLAVNIDFMEYTEVYGGEQVITSGYRKKPGEKLYSKPFITDIALREGFDISKEPAKPVEPNDWQFSIEGINTNQSRILVKKKVIWFVLIVFVMMLIKILFEF